MKIDHVLLAEGVVGDIRGALTLVGYNQRVINSPNLPFSFKQTLVVSLTGKADESVSAQLTINLVTPEGGSVFAFTQNVQMTAPGSKIAPSITNIAMDIPFSGVSYGVYRLNVLWRQVGEDVDEREIEVFIVDPADAGSV
ncbi:DUF6941 family protein [Streptomyces sp. NPDC001685]